MKSQKSLVSPLLKQCFVTTAVGFNIIAHGAAIGYPAVLLPQLALPDSELKLSTSRSSWIASVIGITQLVGSLITPVIMGRCGRKVAHFVVTVTGLVGWTLTAMCGSFEELLIGRILVGLAIGLMAPLRSSLIGEYSSPKYRGALLTTVSLTQSFGIFLVHLIGSKLSWQVTAFIFMFFPFTSLLMAIYSPESPSWLADKGRYDECRQIFRWLRGDDEDEELDEMIEARIAEKAEKIGQRKVNVTSTVRKKEFYKPITLMIHAYIMANFAGATVMASYSTVIIAIVMGNEANVNLWMIILDAQRLIFNTIAVFFINRYKRRTMMFSTVSLAIISQLAIALYVYLKSQGVVTYSAMWVPAVLINVQFFTIATGILPLPNVIGGEVFPLEYRSVGATISLCFLSSTFFISLKTFPGLVESIGLHGTYVVHTAVLVECLLVMWYLLPETKDKTLQQIEDEFRGKPLVEDEEMKVLPKTNVRRLTDARRRSSQRRCSSPILLQ